MSEERESVKCDGCGNVVERGPLTFPDGAQGWYYAEKVLITGLNRVTHERCFKSRGEYGTLEADIIE